MINLKKLLTESPIDVNDTLTLETEKFRQSLCDKYPEIESLYFFASSKTSILHLSEIQIKKESRRKGIGSAIIGEIKEFADEHNLTITLSPAAERGYKQKLSQFYTDLGFIKNKGRHKDYRISSPFGSTMYRRPEINESAGEKIEVPKEAGTVPIPSNHIRLYHYTRVDPNIIRKEGLLYSKARGQTYGEPNFVWASTALPADYKIYAEFSLPIDDPRFCRFGGSAPDPRAKPSDYQDGKHDFTLIGDVKPEEIIAIHEPWHHKYNYLVSRGYVERTLAGEYDNLIDNPRTPEESTAIKAIKINFQKS